MTYWTGVVDESDLCRLGDTPYGLTKLLGLRRTEIDGMYDGETRRFDEEFYRAFYRDAAKKLALVPAWPQPLYF